MIKDIMKDPLFLAQKSTDATKADQQVVVNLLDTLRANLDHCVGMAANMIVPQYIKDHPIYYAGPAKTPQGMAWCSGVYIADLF